MDRRSWLWRRKSSEKSPGETESSGSISSHSERFSDEQASAPHSSQLLEAMSKAADPDEDMNDRVKILSEKLSAALLNISAKEELVKQHSKVAEEAVTGWEKAENEVSVLKKQLESANGRSSSLENRVSHLDGALKECLRQLRQSREEQETKINDIITEKTCEWESINSDLRLKLDAAEKENSALKAELHSRLAELKVRTMELEFSTKAAEMASKQNLESVKKVGKLEAEIRRLKAMARKAAPASSFCAESFTDSQSDAGERIISVDSSSTNEFDPASTRMDFRTSNAVIGHGSFRGVKTHVKNIMVPSPETGLMDDFLEMEKLAGLPDLEGRSSRNGSDAASDPSRENELRSQLDAMINRTAELEEEIEKKDAEKEELQAALEQFHQQLDVSSNCLKMAEARLIELETQMAELKKVNKKKEAENAELETALRQFPEQLKNSGTCLKMAEAKLEELEKKTAHLEAEIEKKEAEKIELEVSLREFHEQLDTSETYLHEAQTRLKELETRLLEAVELKEAAEDKLNSTESQLRVLAVEIGSFRDKVKLLEEELRLERACKMEGEEKRRTLEEETIRMKNKTELWQNQDLQQAAHSGIELELKQEQELEAAATKFAECQKTIASLGQKLKSLALLEDFLADSDQIPGLLNEEDSQHSENVDDAPNKSDPSDVNLPKTEPDEQTGNFSVSMEKAKEKGGTNPSPNRNLRHALGKFSNRGKKIVS